MSEGLFAQSRDQKRRGTGSQRSKAVLGMLALLVAMCATYLYWANTPPPQRYLQPRGAAGVEDAACVAAISGLAAAALPFPPIRIPVTDLREPVARALPAARQLHSALARLRSPGESGGMPVLRDGRTEAACRALYTVANTLRRDGDSGAAAEYALDAMELGCRRARGADVLACLGGIMPFRLGARELGECLPHLAPTQLRSARARIRWCQLHWPAFTEALEADRYRNFQDLRRQLTDPRERALLWFDDDTVRKSFALPLGNALTSLYPKPLTYRALVEYHDTIIAHARPPYVLRTALPLPADPLLRRTRLVAELQSMPQITGYAADRMEARLRLLHVDVAIREFHLARGRFPAALSELANVISAPCGIDPYDGRPLRYRRVGAAYRLYSVGPDGVDDGGVAPLKGVLFREFRGDLLALDPR